MSRLFLAVAALGGLASVAAGAFAAHLAVGPRGAELLRTGALYGMVHAAALVGVAALAQGGKQRSLPAIAAAWCFAVGIVLFSFSLFGLAAGGPRWLGRAAPFGGGALIAGWGALLLLALRRR